MKVLFIPDERNGNPYQRLLAESLSREGIHLDFGTIHELFKSPRKLLSPRRPKIVHIHWQHSFLLASSLPKSLVKSLLFLAELLGLKLLGVKFVWTLHNIHNHEAKFSSQEIFFCKLLASISDQIILHCQSAKGLAEDAYGMDLGDRAIVIPHGNYISAYESGASRSDCREELDIKERDFVFLYFGLIRPYKGVGNLIRTFQAMEDPHLKLLVVGLPHEPEIGETLRNECRGDPRIKCVLKYVPDDRIQLFMNAADIVVLPYEDILMSGAAILAMSFGKPIICPRTGCLPDYLDAAGNILFHSSDEVGLMESMRKAFEVDLAAIGERNLRAANALKWEVIGRRTANVYRGCMGDRTL